jgi:hypothetical protein
MNSGLSIPVLIGKQDTLRIVYVPKARVKLERSKAALGRELYYKSCSCRSFCELSCSF